MSYLVQGITLNNAHSLPACLKVEKCKSQLSNHRTTLSLLVHERGDFVVISHGVAGYRQLMYLLDYNRVLCKALMHAITLKSWCLLHERPCRVKSTYVEHESCQNFLFLKHSQNRYISCLELSPRVGFVSGCPCRSYIAYHSFISFTYFPGTQKLWECICRAVIFW